MKTSSTWSSRSILGKILLGLVLAVMIGSMDVAPALGRDGGHERWGRHDNGRYEDNGRWHDRRGHRGYYNRNRHMYDRRYYRPYGYRQRAYGPPPVIYAPPPPPGIGIFFPPLFIRP